jgi:hypothetical protein
VVEAETSSGSSYPAERSTTVDGEMIPIVAIVMSLSIPIAALYTFYRVRKLRTDERIAALARGVDVPMEPELSQVARSRRYGILFTAGAVGYIITFWLIGRMVDHDAWIAASFGVIPLALGLGYFVDAFLVRRDLRTS